MNNDQENKYKIEQIIKEISNKENITEKDLQNIFRKYPKNNSGLFSKSEILNELRVMYQKKNLNENEYVKIKKALVMKKTRTASGVTPVTVLTKPFPCPGKCIFCPNDIRMPKSYLSGEPGAQRAFRNKFDPYQQTFNRLLAYKNIGHPTDKVELIVLGGTWSSYPKDYQIWFIKRCFDAINDFDPKKDQQLKDTIKDLPYKESIKLKVSKSNSYNTVITKAIKDIKEDYNGIDWEQSQTRCIGLVIETRPDEITEDEVIRIRRLGATKVQLGLQSLNDNVLKKNKRGHDSNRTAHAFTLLRQAGFKIHVHWMPNLYGSTPELDIKDYQKVFNDIRFRPDEIKIYPCSLIESAELYNYYKKELWKPYNDNELLKVLENSIITTPPYCRITRMIRDIGSQDIVVGNKKTNYRQIVEESIKKKHIDVVEIRSREIRNSTFDRSKIKLNTIRYETTLTQEYFLEYITECNKILGFLRLSIPKNPNNNFIDELVGKAMIREIHVYGPSLEIGKHSQTKSQHLGLGEKLIKHAEQIARNCGLPKIAVISSIGTREYYRKKGFHDMNLYQMIRVSPV